VSTGPIRAGIAGSHPDLIPGPALATCSTAEQVYEIRASPKSLPEVPVFPEYLAAVRRRAPYANLAVFGGHSAVRTAVMGEDASVRRRPTADEMAEMKRLVAEAIQQGAIGLGASYSLNHPGHGGVPDAVDDQRPRRVRRAGRRDGRARPRSGRDLLRPRTVAEMEEIAALHGRRIFMGTALALYNEQYPQ
jgi:N-acyl-D-amino-acid deacylase